VAAGQLQTEQLPAELCLRLAQGCADVGVTLNAQQMAQLEAYIVLFNKWNKAYNLSAVRQLEAMISRHLLDSLSVLTYLESNEPKSFIDVGTGGGLPGIPLAIALPHWRWTLLDSNGKKTRFLTEVKTKLALTNVNIKNCRVESLQPDALFDGVISRAFASLEDMVLHCQHLLSPGGSFWAMKGHFPDAELATVPNGFRLLNSWPLTVPGESGERHLLQLSNPDNSAAVIKN